MLITFEGKGCENCPFNGITIGSFERRVSTCMLAYNMKLRKIEMVPEIDLELAFDRDTKPRDCPFAQYPNTLEIQAQE